MPRSWVPESDHFEEHCVNLQNMQMQKHKKWEFHLGYINFQIHNC